MADTSWDWAGATGTTCKRRKTDSPDFNNLLCDLADEITEDTFKEMIYRCSKTIPKGKLQKYTSPFQLFTALTESGFMSENDTKMLEELLEKVGRRDLVERVTQFMIGHASHSGMAEGIEEMLECLKKFYEVNFKKFQPLAWNDNFFLCMSEVYTRLVAEEVDERGSVSKTVAVEEILKVCNGERIRIEGAPAIGKTMFCRKLAYDWASGSLPHFKAVFLLEARRMEKMSIEDAIFDQLLPKSAAFTRSQLRNFLSENGESVAIVLDGLDEMTQSLKESSELQELIIKKSLSSCTIIFTTRPHECDSQLKLCDSHFKVQGFTERDCEGYMLKYFKQNKECVEKLLSTLYGRHSLFGFDQRSFLSNPLHVAFLCVLWEDHQQGYPFPNRVTTLYTDILECIMKRYCIHKGIKLVGDSRQVPDHITNELNKLANIAYYHWKNNATLINVSDVKPVSLLSFGLLVRDCGTSISRPQRLCFFCHKTWQEYFAAKHIANCILHGNSPAEFQPLFDDFQSNYQVMTFLVGILQQEADIVFRAISKNITESLDGNIGGTTCIFYHTMFKIPQSFYMIDMYLELMFESRDDGIFWQFLESCHNTGIMFHDSYRLYVPFSKCKQVDVNQIISRYPCAASINSRNFELVIDILKYEHKNAVNPFGNSVFLRLNTMSSSCTSCLNMALRENCISLKWLVILCSDGPALQENLTILTGSIGATRAVQKIALSHFTKRPHLEKFVSKVRQNVHIQSLAFGVLESPDVDSIPFEDLEQSGPRDLYITGMHGDFNRAAHFMMHCENTTKLSCSIGVGDAPISVKYQCYKAFIDAMGNLSQSLKSFSIGSLYPDYFACERMLNNLKRNSSLEALELQINRNSILSLCDFINSNCHLKSLSCKIDELLMCKNDKDDDLDMLSKLKQLSYTLAGNVTLERFTLEHYWESHCQDTVLSDLLFPVYESMEASKTNLKCFSFRFQDHGCGFEGIKAFLDDNFKKDMTSYEQTVSIRVYSSCERQPEVIPLHVININKCKQAIDH
ncbi:uncharacterized protein [Ptychodera flava]|uniref:uncharacterized protein n=1 Tax=Ptychodera flava TaxID=63121 RepID=UPI00396A1929